MSASDSYEGPRLVVDVSITEFVDGHQTAKCTLRRESGGDYLTTAERVLNALAADPAGGEEAGT